MTALSCESNFLASLPEELNECPKLHRLFCWKNPWDAAWLRELGMFPHEDPSLVALRTWAARAKARRVKAAAAGSEA